MPARAFSIYGTTNMNSTSRMLNRGHIPPFPQRCRHKIPFAEDISFLPEIASLCSDLNIDILVPGVDEELSQMALLENRVAGLKILVPDPDFVDVMLDKLKAAQKLRKKALGAPALSLRSVKFLSPAL